MQNGKYIHRHNDIKLNGQTLAAGLNWQDVNGFFEDIAAKERLTFVDAYYLN